MIKNWHKTAIISSLVLAFVACSNSIPNNNPPLQKENFQDLDKEYHFTSKALTESYLRRKLNFWLASPEKGNQLVKEIAYGMFKNSETLCDVISADNNLLLDEINFVQEVRTRSGVDSAFADFLDNCSVTAPASVGEFQVNTFTTGGQALPVIAMDNNGDFVISWHSSGQDGSIYGVYAQRYNSGGVVQGSEFRVNTFTTGHQSNPSVAMDSAGDFVISWVSNAQDGSSDGVYAQRYNSGGVEQGSEFRVNTFTTGSQSNPSVAIDSAGDFVISWQSDQDGSSYGVYAQRYNSGGVAQGTEFKVNTFTSSYQSNPSIAMDSSGNFDTTWLTVGQDGDYTGIYAQRYNSSGVPQ
jgi:hypothetical protein